MPGSALPTTRFAPSPTGLLHLGSVYAALVAWRAARDSAGRFLLRLEDIDQARCRPEFAAAILDDLRWLGLQWDGPVRVQSEHADEYRAALARLDAMGLLYPCFCTRADIAAAASAPHRPSGVTEYRPEGVIEYRPEGVIDNRPEGADGPLYPGTCRRLDPAAAEARVQAGEPHALRLDMQAARRQAGKLTWNEAGEGRLPCYPERFGDPVLSRKDAPGSYHLCVAHDDALQGVSLVTRAADLRPATSLHRLLQALLGWPEPAYAHHKLLVDKNGRRYAKRDGALTLRALRANGATPAEIVRMTGCP